MLGNPPEAAHFEAVKRFWRISAEPRFIRAVENFVYAVDLDGTEWVLRLTCANRRSIDELASELDWIQFLSQTGFRSPILCHHFAVISLRGSPAAAATTMLRFSVKLQDTRSANLQISQIRLWEPGERILGASMP